MKCPHDLPDHQAAAAENGRAEEDAAERTGETELNTFVLLHLGIFKRALATNSLQRLKSEPDTEVREKSPEIRAERHESVCPDPPPASSQNPPSFNTKVTNTADLNDSREINFEYLKHVVLKFMSSREAEVRKFAATVPVWRLHAASEQLRVQASDSVCLSSSGFPADPSRICAAELQP